MNESKIHWMQLAGWAMSTIIVLQLLGWLANDPHWLQRLCFGSLLGIALGIGQQPDPEALFSPTSSRNAPE